MKMDNGAAKSQAYIIIKECKYNTNFLDSQCDWMSVFVQLFIPFFFMYIFASFVVSYDDGGGGGGGDFWFDTLTLDKWLYKCTLTCKWQTQQN